MSARLAVATLSLAVVTGITGYAVGTGTATDILPVSHVEESHAWEAFDAQVAPEAVSNARVALIGSTASQVTAYNIITVTHVPTGQSYAFSVTR